MLVGTAHPTDLSRASFTLPVPPSRGAQRGRRGVIRRALAPLPGTGVSPDSLCLPPRMGARGLKRSLHS
jgi:hypothetical protein